ncbi:MAG: hypothetical protein H6672_07120 [Anaerolineaceae bacterium]|nr:hypothetical protein [Anaerolineaceae bacterium]
MRGRGGFYGRRGFGAYRRPIVRPLFWRPMRPLFWTPWFLGLGGFFLLLLLMGLFR